MSVPVTSKTAQRKQALQRMCLNDKGELTRDARLVLTYLQRECNGKGEAGFPMSPVTGQIDQTAMVRMAGRREVFDMLVRMLTISLDQRQNLQD